MKLFHKTIKSFMFFDDEFRVGLLFENCTLAELKDRMSIKGRLYIKSRSYRGSKTYKLANSDYEFHVMPNYN